MAEGMVEGMADGVETLLVVEEVAVRPEEIAAVQATTATARDLLVGPGVHHPEELEVGAETLRREGAGAGASVGKDALAGVEVAEGDGRGNAE